jgi:hypothetical protein
VFIRLEESNKKWIQPQLWKNTEMFRAEAEEMVLSSLHFTSPTRPFEVLF